MATCSPTQVVFYRNTRPAASTRSNQQQRNTSHAGGRGHSSNSNRGGILEMVVVENALIFLVVKYVA